MSARAAGVIRITHPSALGFNFCFDSYTVFAMLASWKTCDPGSHATVHDAEEFYLKQLGARLHSMFQGLNVHRRTMARGKPAPER